MKWRSRLFLFASAVLLSAACGQETVPVAPSTTAVITSEGTVWGVDTGVFVLVVDDSDTPEAAELRARVAQSLRTRLLAFVESRWGSCGSPDPAEWHPGDHRVILVRPSAPDGASLVTPIDIPALAWITQTSKEEEIDAVVSAATSAMENRLALPWEPYRPLRAAKRALELVTGERAPESAAEESLVASLPKEKYQVLLVASTRDDEDVTPVAGLVPSEAALETTYQTAVMAPSSAASEICTIEAPGNTRIGSWGALFSYSIHAWPCDYQNTWDLLLHPGWADCGLPCEDRPIKVDENGVADCKVHVEQPDLERCDPARGWRDPGGKATLVERSGRPLRRCEVVQLEGANLESCRTSIDCPDCPAGFCVTDLFFKEEDQCWPEGTHLWPFRFIGGSRIVSRGWLDITCTTAD